MCVSKQEILSSAAHTPASVHYLVVVNICIATRCFFSQETCKTTSWSIFKHTVGTEQALHNFPKVQLAFLWVVLIRKIILMCFQLCLWFECQNSNCIWGLWVWLAYFFSLVRTSYIREVFWGGVGLWEEHHAVLSSRHREQIKMATVLAVRLLNDASVQRVKQLRNLISSHFELLRRNNVFN